MLSKALRRAESVNRPLGSPAFLGRLERKLTLRKRGPKPADRKQTGK
jgi:hypothetical protein